MDSRERVFLTLDHQVADRVPFDFWASAGAWAVLTGTTGRAREEILDAHDVDLRYIEGPRYAGPPLAPDTDIWGVKRQAVTVKTPFGRETYSEVQASPLAGLKTPEEVEAYAGWPDPDHFDYAVVRGQALAVRERGRVAVFMGDRLNRVAQLKPAMYLRGVEQIMIDLALAPELARAIFGKIREFYLAYLERILAAADGAIDIILTGDDFGQQNGLLVSPRMWEDFLAEGFGAFMAAARAGGARTMHHTCGDVRLLAGRLSELGLDVLQSLQPEAMADGYAELKREHGAKLCFAGGVSIQRTLPRGKPADIVSEVRERIAVLGAGGGYILGTAHNIQADTPPDNMLALLGAERVIGLLNYVPKCDG